LFNIQPHRGQTLPATDRNLVRFYREKQGFKHKLIAFATETGLCASTIKNIELYDARCLPETRAKIAAVLGVPEEVLWPLLFQNQPPEETTNGNVVRE